jgi:hypothetical protein
VITIPSMSTSLKSISRPQWLVILTVFLLIIGLHVWVDTQQGLSALNGDQYYEAVFAKKQMTPSLYASDPYYSNSANFELYTPFFLTLVKAGFKKFDFYTTFAIFQPFLGFVYLMSMFVLLYKLTGRVGLSVSMALLSAPVVPTFPTENWGGALSIGYVIPRTFFLAVFPGLFYAWLRFQTKPKKLCLVYMVLGLLTYVHPPSGLTITAAFLTAQLFSNRLSLHSLKIACLCGLSALIVVIPFATQYFAHTQEARHIPPDQFPLYLKAAFYRLKFIDPQFIISYLPHALLDVLGWLILATWAACRIKKSSHPLIAYFALACLGIFIAYFLVTFLILVPNHILPCFIEFTRITKFIFLPVVAVITLWLARFQGRALLGRLALVFFLGVFLSYPDLIQDLQHGKLAAIPNNQWKAFAHKSDFILDSQKKKIAAQYREQEEMALWMKAHLPSNGTLIHVAESAKSRTDTVFLRALSERGFLLTRKDGAIFYYSNKPLYLHWYQEITKLLDIRQSHTYCSRAEQAFARSRHANYLLCYQKDDQPVLPQIAGLPVIHQSQHLRLLALTTENNVKP